jgi:hypothetical protein
MQDYSNFEILLSVGDDEDPCIPTCRKLMDKYPNVKASLLIG